MRFFKIKQTITKCHRLFYGVDGGMVSDYSGKHNDMAGRLATLALNGTAHTPAENSTFPSSRVSPRVSPFATSLLIPLLACAEPE